MRKLVLLRGCPASGKSTWVKNNNLEQYTLSADNIRLLFQSPLQTAEGKMAISPRNDKRVWDLLFSLLEERMERGELTVVDATHSKKSAISQYKKLAQKYRYRVYVVDFTDVSLETALRQNRERESHKFVPEDAITNIYERTQIESPPSWVTTVKPEELNEIMDSRKQDLNEYKKIHVIGDIHGCYTALREYLQEVKDDEMYIFCGDYLDRGIENAETLKYLISLVDNKNVIFLEGNHDTYLRKYAHDIEVTSRTFLNKTVPEIEAGGITKSEIRQFTRRFHQLVYFSYNDWDYIVTHGGIANMPDNFTEIATEQFIKGVGEYSDDIDLIFNQNTEGKRVTQLHAHRNMFKLPVRAFERSYNLEGGVEKGAHLRAVTIDEDGITYREVKNDVYVPPSKPEEVYNVEELSVEDFVTHLKSHDYIREAKMPNNISSFNFTKQAFRRKKWDDVNVKARGLFINRDTNEIVSRSYDKFFNINERSFTKVSALASNLVFPVTVYEKENGYLGTVGYDSARDCLVFTSKSQTSEMEGAEHAKWMEEMFYKTFKEDIIEDIKRDLKLHKVSFVFEVILVDRDPHIIEYKEDKLVLLDIVSRDMKYSKREFQVVQDVADVYGVECKKVFEVFDNWTDFYRWYISTTQDNETQLEGYIIEDSVGFMTKLKLPYYNFWKQMRGLKHKLAGKNSHTFRTGSLYTSQHTKFYGWAKEKDQNYLAKTDIIQLRNEFEKDSK